MNFPSIRIEGAILSPDILDRLEDIHGQRPVDFGFDSSTKVKDEIVRAWADAQDYWRIFQRKVDGLRADSPATTETRNLWIVPLLGLLGYQTEYQHRAVEVSGKTYAISHRATNRGQTPVHIIGCKEPSGLDKKPEKAVLRMSAHAMLQEFLNLQEELYGIVTNGRLLRLLRDSSRLVKLSYLEFDLDRIFTDGLFADFAVMFRLLHSSRLPATIEGSSESLIERYHQDSLDSGARIRDGLSRAVEQAISDFANGFLSHPENVSLRESISSGTLLPKDYYQHLLRLIYRILFLLVIEERDLVYPKDADTKKRNIYYDCYSLQRLRRLSEKRWLADRSKHDLWLSLLTGFRLFEAGGPGTKLGIAPLAGDLFSPNAIRELGQCMLGNDVLLGCLRALNMYENLDTHQTIRVNYAALNVEEFGSVYEGLLEYEPVFNINGNRIEFAFAQGGERAATGSHYTPDDLVQPLLKHSLDYLIADKLKESDKEKALLSLRVADISCGSGHILLAAARRIATELAIVRTKEDQPSPKAFREAQRDVIRECIYGVDINPLAVELCKVALWLEAHNPGMPLNFLDHHIKCGNAIVGFTRRGEVEKGVPDEAFIAMPGDDKETASNLRKRNKQEREKREQIPETELELSPNVSKYLEGILTRWRDISNLSERTPEEIDTKKQRYIEFTQSQDAWLLNQISSIPIAQFYLSKSPENETKVITDAEFLLYWTGKHHPQGQGTAAALTLAHQKRFFHWFLEFPEIIQRGGFDCILGNPPYLMNRKIKRTLGDAFLNWVRFEYEPAGAVDLVTYFFRRIFELLKPHGFMSLISTNTISQGAAREGGLDVIAKQGGNINFAVRSRLWPGRASVSICLLAIYKGNWSRTCLLDGQNVKSISSYLDTAEAVGNPFMLTENADKSFQGSIVLGTGFILDPSEAKSLINRIPRLADVIYPYLNGSDLNSNPEQLAKRWVINFFDWPEEKCQIEYPDAYSIIEARVKPERTRRDEKGNFVLRKPLPERWWIYADKRPKLYSLIRELHRVLVIAQVSRTVAFAFVSPKQVLDAKLIVFPFEQARFFAVLQSSLHYHWAWRYCTTMKTDLTYAPSAIFAPFPMPEMSDKVAVVLDDIGENYHERRRFLMRKLWLGLTDTYNLFHTRDLSPEKITKMNKKSSDEAEAGYNGILELRRLNVEMDTAIRDAYGWNDIDLGHDFHELETLPENDRVRYTISPDARREVLKRLLALNHERAAQQSVAPAPKKTTRRKKDSTGQLFADEGEPND